jgi:hypothetical protein
MNWGLKIIILYTGFILLVLVLVILSYRQDLHLVVKDYYQREVNYQEEIEMLRNARSIPDELWIEYQHDEKMLVIHYPSHQHGKLTGNIEMIRPSDASMDTGFTVKTNEDNVQSIRTGSLKKGLWKIKIYWELNNRKYLEEKDIILQ